VKESEQPYPGIAERTGDPMQIITADQIMIADNPHGVDVRHL
jgi:hypothetical protein